MDNIIETSINKVYKIVQSLKEPVTILKGVYKYPVTAPWLDPYVCILAWDIEETFIDNEDNEINFSINIFIYHMNKNRELLETKINTLDQQFLGKFRQEKYITLEGIVYNIYPIKILKSFDVEWRDPLRVSTLELNMKWWTAKI